ncbi:MAG TPA: geranyl transferase [Wolbachia sp.]|jgi:farnesyl diphosphate synthase|uniref:polyprenyl synthetase family protein n=1 Tax=Wolbachia endosymbiont of Pentalonia nigronervosa TaxID=1301914 RepID=UPI000ED95ACC|nr:polyprenyl synthetase family protein [Wolbachia endosymbiont of Pentalonia nigronervosa]MBD0391441.1 polyprenyl synthetase family protein [Wolbachia endosymbiont of Pentalonia nigronervosa]HCE59512.1 geranyl transferase [Wolbachia sp.]
MKQLIVAEIERLVPENNQDKLISAMRYILLAPAKYIRPSLVIASAQVFDVAIERVLPIAVAVEFVHAYSLIHDDLPCMDNSDTRRGQPSCHKKFDEATAVLAGDALLTLVFETLSSLNDEKCCEIIKVLSQAIGHAGMVRGQVLDIESKGNENVDSDHIKNIHLLKTAKLFAVSCEIGAIIGSATNEQRRALYNYGTHLGLIFQANDDIADYEQNNLISKNKVKSYIEDLFNQALQNLSILSGNTDYLYNLLSQIKNNG